MMISEAMMTPMMMKAPTTARATPTTRPSRVKSKNAGRGWRTRRRAADGEPKKLWGGRFSEAQDPLMEKFNESLSFDKRMWREDVDGSVGYSSALARAGVITEAERRDSPRVETRRGGMGGREL